tara:strand:- start:1402 stop:1995 length:594 start_codon:yes stop_codon:yes gene_type:complete
MTCGIYQIKNIINGMMYIGSSVNIQKRWQQHLRLLRKNSHENSHLQNSFNKHGESNFEFSVLIEVDREQLLIEEQKYMDDTKCYDRNVGFNKSITAGHPTKGNKISEATRAKMKEAKRGYIPVCAHMPMSEEGKKRISEIAKTRTGHKNPNSRLTPEQITEMRKDFKICSMTNGEIAKKYGVSISTIKRIKSGKTYK